MFFLSILLRITKSEGDLFQADLCPQRTFLFIFTQLFNLVVFIQYLLIEKSIQLNSIPTVIYFCYNDARGYVHVLKQTFIFLITLAVASTIYKLKYLTAQSNPLTIASCLE